MGRTAETLGSVLGLLKRGRSNLPVEERSKLEAQFARGMALADMKKYPGWTYFAQLVEKRKKLRFDVLVNDKLNGEQLASAQAAYRELDVLMKEFDLEIELAREAGKKLDALEAQEQE